ncbi:UNVERIFIED_CONTAM: hypothetical protein Sradi_0772100 [Sesamum radiatum]|uniref:Uncharacterized protein n=1 Tax=Sesamum radiatum TaxID=300843 RepID=A0AAW2VT06_SESRA
MSTWEQGLLSAEATPLRRCCGVEAQLVGQQAWEVLRRQSHWLGPGMSLVRPAEPRLPAVSTAFSLFGALLGDFIITHVFNSVFPQTASIDAFRNAESSRFGRLFRVWAIVNENLE